MEAQPALHWTARRVVLDPVADKDLEVALLGADRHFDLDFAKWRLEQQPHFFVEADQIGGLVEKAVCVLVVVDLFSHDRSFFSR